MVFAENFPNPARSNLFQQTEFVMMTPVIQIDNQVHCAKLSFFEPVFSKEAFICSIKPVDKASGLK